MVRTWRFHCRGPEFLVGKLRSCKLPCVAKKNGREGGRKEGRGEGYLRHSDTEEKLRGKGHVKTERSEGWVYKLRNAKERHRMDSPLEPPGGASPADALILDFRPPELSENTFLLF